MTTPLRVGDVLGNDEEYGTPDYDVFVGGYFDKDYDGPFRVEAIGADWVIARGRTGQVHCAFTDPERLLEYRQ